METKIMGTIIITLIIGALIVVSGQILIKKGLSQIGQIEIKSIKMVLPTILKLITNKFIFLGLVCSAIGAFFWMIALSRSQLSVAYPIGGGLVYVFLVLFSWLLLKETITLTQIIGIAVIILGITLVSK